MPAYVATLVANPAETELSDAEIGRVAQGLAGDVETRWLAPGEAVDLIFAGPAEAPELRAAAEELGADLIVQPLETRDKKLLVADMDSTLIGQECIDELAEIAGIGARVAAITERAMRGELEFAAALRERVGLLAGLPIAAIEKLLAERITLNAGARTLAATFRARGGYFAIVSGGFVPFTGAVAAWLGADEHRANRLEIADGRLTGRVLPPIQGADAKLGRCANSARGSRCRFPRPWRSATAPMICRCSVRPGSGVAYRAKPKVAAAAHARVERGDLTALLYAMGVRRQEFVGA